MAGLCQSVSICETAERRARTDQNLGNAADGARKQVFDGMRNAAGLRCQGFGVLHCVGREDWTAMAARWEGQSDALPIGRWRNAAWRTRIAQPLSMSHENREQERSQIPNPMNFNHNTRGPTCTKTPRWNASDKPRVRVHTRCRAPSHQDQDQEYSV